MAGQVGAAHDQVASSESVPHHRSDRLFDRLNDVLA
jgi:hypothetical protein